MRSLEDKDPANISVASTMCLIQFQALKAH